MTYVLKMNGGVTHQFADIEAALAWAKEWEGMNAHHECSDGRVFLYASIEDCDVGENGLEIGVIEEVAE